VPRIDGNSASDRITLVYGAGPGPDYPPERAVFTKTGGFVAVYHFLATDHLRDNVGDHVLSGGAKPGDPGLIAGGLLLDGVHAGPSYLGADDHPDLEPPSFTLSCWFRRGGYRGSEDDLDKIVNKGRPSEPFLSYTLESRTQGRVGFQTDQAGQLRNDRIHGPGAGPELAPHGRGSGRQHRPDGLLSRRGTDGRGNR
jgi:hypothetical protein